MPSYSEKLLDPRWQKKKGEILIRDKHKCTLCDDTETSLEIHHKKYVWGKDPWELDIKYLTTLCKVCHEVAGVIFKLKNRYPTATMKHDCGDTVTVISIDPANHFCFFLYTKATDNAIMILKAPAEVGINISRFVKTYSNKNILSF